jgi:LPS export ABC transporter protein LptC
MIDGAKMKVVIEMKWSTRIVYILAVLGFLLSACSEEPTEEIAFKESRAADEIFSDFVTQESDSGLVRWILTAPRASRFKEDKLVVLDKPSIEFYDEHGDLRTTLVSESGEYYEDRRDMLAFGNVVVTTVDGDVLETDSLLWSDKERKILSDSFVKLTQDGSVITGYGLECDEDLGSLDIKRDVKATVVDEEGEITE